ncbi:hypothetical protein GQ55_3G442900 [Panicum hallii var. hallii]|uniref:Uncharacterized protein n=1 Tax=Panicum hallii var. hallii TaxID=1504633 RepID=A0A2T7EI69_9POAL|nr:hypothetical protein GQ55_3G442900 [Panicum hallii var. hallii]
MIFLHRLPLWKHWYACKIGCRPWVYQNFAWKALRISSSYLIHKNDVHKYLVPPIPPSLATSFRSMK